LAVAVNVEGIGSCESYSKTAALSLLSQSEQSLSLITVKWLQQQLQHTTLVQLHNSSRAV